MFLFFDVSFRQCSAELWQWLPSTTSTFDTVVLRSVSRASKSWDTDSRVALKSLSVLSSYFRQYGLWLKYSTFTSR